MPAHTAHGTAPEREGAVPWWGRAWEWRSRRPFGAGVCTMAAGLVILLPPYAALRLGEVTVAVQTLGGSAALVIGVTLLACGAAMWMRPGARFPVWMTLLMAGSSIPAANLGSLLIGALLGVLGFALGLAWAPPEPEQEPAPDLEPERAPRTVSARWAEQPTEPIPAVLW